MRKAFVHVVAELFAEDPGLFLMLGDIGVYGFRGILERYPERAMNFGIMEQTMISAAAGLADQGFVPIIHTIAPFVIERAYEQIKVDLAYNQKSANIVSVGGSYDYSALGPTHHCPADVNLLLNIPDSKIFLPGSVEEFSQLFKENYRKPGINYFRLSESYNKKSYTTNDYGFALCDNGADKSDIAVISFGSALKKVEGLFENGHKIDFIYFNKICHAKDKICIFNYSKIVIVAEFFGSGVEDIVKNMVPTTCEIARIDIPIGFIGKYGSKEEIDTHLRLDPDSVKSRIRDFLYA